MQIIQDRITNHILSEKVDTESVQKLMESIGSDGAWPNINYKDTGREAFMHTIHLKNMLFMAKAYRAEGSALRNNRKLYKKLSLAIDFWINNDFQCENWWHNQIGTPTRMLELLYLLDKKLTPAQQQAMIKIASRANMDAQGARPSGDRIRIAALVARRALWLRNTDELCTALGDIEREMDFYNESNFQKKLRPHYFAPGHGMECDYSFHHRPDNVNNTLTYGDSFAESFMLWAMAVRNTKFGFSEKTIHQMIDFYLDGMCKQMPFGIKADPGVMNREMARKGETIKVWNCSTPQILIQLSDYRHDELQNLISNRQGNQLKNIESFAKMFWRTDYFVCQRPDYFASARMFSNRCANMEEPYNGEGFTNHYKADGACFISRTGTEYDDIWPVFDFRKIPGTTVMQQQAMPSGKILQQIGLTDFAGGVTDGLYGAAAFDFVSPHNLVKARKSWFFFNNMIVCLGAGITCWQDDNICTTINQCHLRGEVEQGRAENTQWFIHDSIAYIIHGKDTRTILKTDTVQGSWRNVNRQSVVDTTTIRKPVFSLWIDHGTRVRYDSDYAYCVIPGSSATNVANETSNPSYRILVNNKYQQAVCNDSEGVAYAVFYHAGTIQLNSNTTITSSSPGIVMLRYDQNKINQITVADPAQNLLQMKITVTTSTAKTPYEFDLPQQEWAGSSVTKNI